MARAVKRLRSIDPERCRASVAERYDVSVTVAGYERLYRRAIAADRRPRAWRAAGNVSESIQLPKAPLSAS
jgi:hypothetical protein